MTTIKTADLKAKYELYTRRAEQLKALMDDPGLLEELIGVSTESEVKAKSLRLSPDLLGPYKDKLTEAINAITSDSNKMDSKQLHAALRRNGFPLRTENDTPKGLGHMLKTLHKESRINRVSDSDRRYFPFSGGTAVRASWQLPLTNVSIAPSKVKASRKRYRPNRPDTPEIREEVRTHFIKGIVAALTNFPGRTASADRIFEYLWNNKFDFQERKSRSRQTNGLKNCAGGSQIMCVRAGENMSLCSDALILAWSLSRLTT